MKNLGIELGIRAPLEAIQKAGHIAGDNNLEYYFIPETHPNFIGVDAFEAIHSLIGKVGTTWLGTGIVNVFSRSEEEILEVAKKLYQKSNHNFVLGLGTSAPTIVEDMYKVKFEKPVLRIKHYTAFLKSKYSGPIFWAAVGDKMTELAAEYSDGIMFFLKPEEEIKRSIRIIEKKLSSINRDYDSFEVISIRPTSINRSDHEARNGASLTLAGYIGANEFYSRPLCKCGFEKEVSVIRKNFKISGLAEAATKVSDKLIEELTTFGTPEDCAMKLNEYTQRTKVKTVVAGFDLPKNGYNGGFMDNLAKLARGLEK